MLQKHFGGTSARTKALLLSTYAKLENLYPEVRPLVQPVFEKHAPSTELELQQRACEYSSLLTQGDEIMDAVLQEMPAWPEDKESALEARLRKKQEAAEDRTGFQKSVEGREGGVGGMIAAAVQKPGPMSPTAAGASRGGEGGGGGVDNFLDFGSNDGEGGGRGGGGGTAALTAAMGKASISPVPDEDDLLGVGGAATSSSSSSSSSNGVQTIPEEIRPRLATAFKALITTPAGVLFENEVLQIGIKQDYRGSQGRVALFYGNKTTGELSNFKAELATVSFLRVQSQDPPPTIGAGQQAKHQLAVEVLKPFDYPEAPFLLLSFTSPSSGQTYSYSLPLPIVPTCFFEPVTLAASDYMTRWRSLEGQNRERQEVIQQPPNFNYESSGLVAFRAKILDGLHLAQAQGIDQNDLSLSAVGSLRTGTAGPDGSKISVGALVRIEVNAQVRAVRVTARAVHGTVAAALVNTIKALVS